MGQGFRSHRHLFLAGGLIAVTVVAVALLVMFWGWLSNGESGSTTIRNVALVLAGLVALPLAAWRGIVADRQAVTAQQGLLNERYQKAAEMLGNEVLSVRLAGIFALQRLATEHPGQYHVQVMRLFCAFIRLPTRDQNIEPGNALFWQAALGTRQDVESVLDAIGSREETRRVLERRGDVRLDFRGANLSGAQILNADLSKTIFQNSNLFNVNFANTDLTGANFSNANLSMAQFYEVDFTGIHLLSANLSGAMLQDAEMVRLSLHNVNLSDANLGRANLSKSNLQGSNVASAWLDGADLTGVNFLKADLSKARLDRADLTGAKFLDADLTDANISESNLSGVRFSNDGLQAAKGLTQTQIDQARADPDNPPKLVDVLDTETGKHLVWRGQAPNEKA